MSAAIVPARRWYCAKTIGRETRAEFYLRRAGIESFRPVIHRYFIDRRTRQERYRILSLFPGYVFVRITSDEERDRARGAIGVAYLLGEWHGTSFKPREMPSQWMADLLSAGPIIQGKKCALKKGDRVKRALGSAAGLADIIGEIDEVVDKSRFAIVKTMLFGAERRVKIAVDDLELAG